MSLRAWAGLATSATSATDSTDEVARVAGVATVATRAEGREAANDFPPVLDPDTLRRRERAFALLDADPTKRFAVVAERGDPAHVYVAYRGGWCGEVVIPAEKYDGFALLALMREHGNA